MLGSVSMLSLLWFGNVCELFCFDFGCVLYCFVKIIYSLPLFKKIKIDLVSPDYISWVSSVPLRFLYYLNFRGLTLSISRDSKKPHLDLLGLCVIFCSSTNTFLRSFLSSKFRFVSISSISPISQKVSGQNRSKFVNL